MKFWQVDSFTNQVFKGNPAAVFPTESALDTSFMQLIAREMNLSETAFVRSVGDSWELRWMTPNSEVDLCGHATLAAAHVLWEQGFTKAGSLSFKTRSGELKASKDGSMIWLNFPIQEARERPLYKEMPALNLDNQVEFAGSNGQDAVMIFDNEAAVRNYLPDLSAISSLPERGFIVSAASNNYDYVYRAFFPKLNIAEDPVTGSANTLLAPYWASRLNKNELRAYQASERSGELWLNISGDRVNIGGNAITVFEGQASKLSDQVKL